MRVKEIWDRIEADSVEESQYQIPHPELGPLERRVGRTYEDALFQDDIDIDDTNYWFNEPEGAPAREGRVQPVITQGGSISYHTACCLGSSAPHGRRHHSTLQSMENNIS